MAAVAAFLTHSTAATIATFFVALAIAVRDRGRAHRAAAARLGRRAPRQVPRARSTPGLNFIIPFIDARRLQALAEGSAARRARARSASRSDNTQLQVDGILYFQVTDPMRASLRLVQLHRRDHPARADVAAHVIGKMELDKTFEERDDINRQVVQRARRGRRATGA